MKEPSTYERPRPVIELAGTPFYVDAQWLYFIEVGCPDNKIDMGETCGYKDHIELWYDPTIKNAYQGCHQGTPPEHILVYWFHSFDALDPVGAEARLDELNPDWRTVFDHGLPVINIAGRQFYVDKKNKCFYEVNNSWNWIWFKEVVFRNHIKGLYINLSCHNIPFPHELDTGSPAARLPDHIVFAPIPKGTRAAKIINRFMRRKK
jgi:hypothetical protein